ncbi:hypothetical protein LF1_08410 [Rubripirellula obstinata]|uniref:Uncharacterized protein n=1 Tax=Rubripirellula obstinata TaxID=406547 RepID=A0A5B1CGJ6_9BACT|nr:hypothetical protein [Rubripirellula obstinata]KAA1258324.1 hypothetical protein LF1_08410 [Rubripirellula obstinata]
MLILILREFTGALAVNDNQNVMTEILAQQGHSELEIQRLLIRLQDYDKRTIRDSVFHSIADGTFSISVGDNTSAEETVRQWGPVHAR